ncbi:hypothetical protein OAT67_01825 [Bacteriovoracaceae bacterium]|nr:hypothetical protein [Bacteriovoracaceae bacterium]
MSKEEVMAKKKGNLSKLKPVKYTIPIKAENDDSLSIRLPSSLKERLESFAEDNEVKANALVRHILEQFLDAQNA